VFFNTTKTKTVIFPFRKPLGLVDPCACCILRVIQKIDPTNLALGILKNSCALFEWCITFYAFLSFIQSELLKGIRFHHFSSASIQHIFA